eukprot:14758162-Ditylum_brightwellii.AAC.1
MEVIVGLPQAVVGVDLVLLVAPSCFVMAVLVAEVVELVLPVVGCYAALGWVTPGAPGAEGLVPHFLVFVGNLVLMRRGGVGVEGGVLLLVIVTMRKLLVVATAMLVLLAECIISAIAKGSLTCCSYSCSSRL